MNIGGSIALIIIGAILAFAVRVDLPGVDIFTLGVIVMIGGAIWLVLSLALRSQRDDTEILTTTETTERHEVSDGDVIVRRVEREVFTEDDV